MGQQGGKKTGQGREEYRHKRVEKQVEEGLKRGRETERERERVRERERERVRGGGGGGAGCGAEG